MRTRSRSRATALRLAARALAATLAPSAAHAQLATVHAVRGTPAVDGALGDAAWQGAPWTPRFVQRQPALGARATHGARARIAYDDDALYVAVECEATARPVARLGRRDAIPNGDWVRVMVDARGEGASAFSFAVNPAGVQADAVVQGDSDWDGAWDAVWNAEPRVSAHGWTVEYRIPWRVLRFDTARLRFRVQVDRYDYETGESVALVAIPADAPRFVAAFAPLVGVERVSSGRVFQLQPYAVGRVRVLQNPALLDPTPTLSGTLGGDLKLGLTNDLVLDATVNPDFGQVEVDPAVINLSTYEVFFPERRPFFLEGTDIFNTPLRILHTRRIGAAPGAPDPRHANGTIESVDPAAPIWGAAKVTGRVGPASVMLLDAVTGYTHATERWVDPSGATARELRTVGEPTNWLAARVRVPVAQGSSVGGIFTHVGRFTQPNDAVGGIDWDFRAPDGRHRFRGQIAASQAWNATDGVHTGQGMLLEVARAEDPAWVWVVRARGYSRGFDPNGLGYLERPDYLSLTVDTTFRTPRPVGPLRSAYVNPWAWRATNTEGLLIDQGAGLEVGITGRTLWNTGAGVIVNSAQFDDRETRGGIAYALDPNVSAWGWVSSDRRLPLSGTLSFSVATQNGGHRANGSLSALWIPAPFLSLSWAAGARSVTNVPRWVENVVDPRGLTHPIFGQQNAVIVDTTLRASLAFSRRATLDLYSQLLLGSIRYDHYAELTAPDHLGPYAYAGNADYDTVSLLVNAVARYEYLPGSFATLVLLHRQALTAGAADAGFDRGAGLLGDAPPDTLLMAKMTYLFF
nr:hypothetical protein [uncultured bacterium]